MTEGSELKLPPRNENYQCLCKKIYNYKNCISNTIDFKTKLNSHKL